MCFTEPAELTREAIRQIPRNPAVPAVYKILPPKAKWEKGIPRFLGTDKERILFYGQTGNLRDRLGALLRGMDHENGHAEGNLIRILRREIPRFGLTEVLFSYREVASKEEAKDDEERLIKQYVRRFGEVPPINSAIPNRDGEWSRQAP